VFTFDTKPPALANLTTIGGKMLQSNEYSLQLAYYSRLTNGIGLSRLRGMSYNLCRPIVFVYVFMSRFTELLRYKGVKN